MKTAIVWLRRDLRLIDNPALDYALSNFDKTLVVYIYSEKEDGQWSIGAASKWWLHHSLQQLADDFSELKSKLIIKVGNSLEILKDLVEETGASGIFWNRLYEPKAIKRDTSIKSYFKTNFAESFEVKSFNSYLLIEPWDFSNGTGKPYQVFTPFWRKLSKEIEVTQDFKEDHEIKVSMLFSESEVSSLLVSDLKLLPSLSWDEEFYRHWKPGYKNAIKNLLSFFNNKVQDYQEQRDFLALDANSHLAAPLHFGEISPKQIWAFAQESKVKNAEPFLRQLGWREFSAHLLYHFPKTDLKPLRDNFAKFPWKKNKRFFKKWSKGHTGYPIVDAAMNELWVTGSMHNRARMIVASFLVKDLLISWQDGARWFWDTLVDADLANNTMGWQWVAGCGADAAPYFRIFNPVLQGERFDKEGDYVRRWLPVLSRLPNKWLHKPWEAPKEVLLEADIELGVNYPYPIVDHAEAKEDALEAYDVVKNSHTGTT